MVTSEKHPFDFRAISHDEMEGLIAQYGDEPRLPGEKYIMADPYGERQTGVPYRSDDIYAGSRSLIIIPTSVDQVESGINLDVLRGKLPSDIQGRISIESHYSRTEAKTGSFVYSEDIVLLLDDQILAFITNGRPHPLLEVVIIPTPVDRGAVYTDDEVIVLKQLVEGAPGLYLSGLEHSVIFNYFIDLGVYMENSITVWVDNIDRPFLGEGSLTLSDDLWIIWDEYGRLHGKMKPDTQGRLIEIDQGESEFD